MDSETETKLGRRAERRLAGCTSTPERCLDFGGRWRGVLMVIVVVVVVVVVTVVVVDDVVVVAVVWVVSADGVDIDCVVGGWRREGGLIVIALRDI